jgi:hypothetical protein
VCFLVVGGPNSDVIVGGYIFWKSLTSKIVIRSIIVIIIGIFELKRKQVND